MMRLNPAYSAIEEMQKEKECPIQAEFLQTHEEIPQLYCVLPLKAETITLTMAGKTYQSEKTPHISIFKHYKEGDTKALNIFHYTWYGFINENNKKTSVVLHAYFNRNGQYLYCNLKEKNSKVYITGISENEEKTIQQYAQAASNRHLKSITWYISVSYMTIQNEITTHLNELDKLSKNIKTQLAKYTQVAERCLNYMQQAVNWTFDKKIDTREKLLRDVVEHMKTKTDISRDKIHNQSFYNTNKTNNKPKENPQQIQETQINQNLQKQIKQQKEQDWKNVQSNLLEISNQITAAKNDTNMSDVDKALHILRLINNKYVLLMKSHSHPHMEMALIDVLIAINKQHEEMYPVFETAAKNNDIQSMRLLRPYIRKITNQLLFELIRNGNHEICQYIINEFDECLFYINNTVVPVSEKLEDLKKAYVPLALTLTHDNTMILEALLKYGADPNFLGATTESNNAILFIAVNAEKEDFVRVLLENGANPNPILGNTTTRYAHPTAGCTKNDRTLNKFMHNIWNNGSRVSGKSDGIPLQEAIRTRNLTIIELLLKHGASATQQDDQKFDALGWETCHMNRSPNIEIVKLLLQYGANINAIQGENSMLSPLFYSCQQNRLESVIALVELGADPNIPVLCKAQRDIDGISSVFYENITPFQRAFIKGYNEIVLALLQQKKQPISFTTLAMTGACHMKMGTFFNLTINEQTLDYEFTDNDNYLFPIFKAANDGYDENTINREVAACFETGKKYYKEKNHEQALSYFILCFLFGRGMEYRVSSINYIGCCYQKKGENELAMKFFNLCAKHSPETTVGIYAAEQIKKLQPANERRTLRF